MLGKLPKLPWGKQKPRSAEQSPPPATHPSAAPDDRQFIETLINDSSEKKRLAACAKVKDPDVLLKASREDNSDQIRTTAARQYARSLSENTDARNFIKEYSANSENRHLALLITAHHADSEIREFGVSMFNQDDDYAVIATETRFHDTRELVTRHITSLEVVDKVWRQIKTKDKVVARMLKERLQKHQQQTAQIAEQKAEIDKITEEMDKLANGAWSPNFITRYDLFVNRWNALDFDICDTDRQRFEELRNIASDKVEKNRERQELQDTLIADVMRLGKIPGTLDQTTLTELNHVLKNAEPVLQSLRSKWLEGQPSAQLEDKQLREVRVALNRAEKGIQQAKSAVRAYEQVNGADEIDFDELRANRKVLQDTIETQSSGSQTPVYAAEFPALLQAVEKKLKNLTQENTQLKAAVHKQFGSLNSAISASKWGPARSIYERIEKKITKLPGNDRQALTDKLAGFEKRLNELGDWKQFATEPKLEALCEEMEKLPAHKLSPKDQADRIKELQNKWKAMGASPAQEKHWPRFKAAADIAFAPCAEYFARRREDKEAKLAQREEILTMLRQYDEQVDWDNPDWRLVEKTIRTAKNEWHKLRIYDRRATAKQEESFTVVLAALNKKLQPAYEQGRQEKEELITRVKTLGEGEINQHCMNQVKRLQSQWRRTGIVERADDQRLWKEFNQACSEIYDVHRGKKKEQYAASVEHVKRAREIIRELREAGGDNSSPDENRLQSLQEEFRGLPEFPERDQKFLFRDFNRAIDGLEKQRELHTASARELELQRLKHNANICAQLELLAGQSSEQSKTQIDQYLGDWDEGHKTDNPEWKKAINLRRDSIVAHLQAGTLPDFKANTMARRLLCIDLEILLDKQTPQEDKQLRMQHQLDLLQQGMTSTSIDSVEDRTRALQIQWLTAFPADTQERDKLNTRFETTLSS